MAMLHCFGMAFAGAAPIDRYVVLEHLSDGGMGTIYVGKKLGAGGFEMEVVLKQLLPEFTEQKEFIDLFLREARLSATLHHANIIHTIDLVTTGGEYFIVMEYLPGADLRTLLRRAKRRGKRLTPKAAVYISREVLSALAYAHTKRDDSGNPIGLIHRDVSPANVLLSPAGEVKLTDFGIAKATSHTSRFYKVKGKVGYMSPEQAKSEPLDHRSDLYSLAVCTYEVLVGERLFVTAGLTTSAEVLYSQPIPRVSHKVPGLSSDFDAIMAKALAIDPDRRFQTAGELQEALMRCAHRNGLLMPAAGLAAELRDACGPVERWRDGEADDSAIRGVPRGATEVYDPNEAEESPLESAEFANAAAGASRGIKAPAAVIDRFQGKELTSIIFRDEQALTDAEAGANQSPPIQRERAAEINVAATPSIPAQQAGSSASQPLGADLVQAPGGSLNPIPAYNSTAPLIPWWFIIGIILLIASIAAAIVAFSGPSVHGR